MSAAHFSTSLILLDGLVAGVFVGSSLVEHAARVLHAPVWIAYKQAKEAVFAPVMPLLFGFSLLMTAAAAFALPRHMILAAATGLMAIVLGITVRVHLPLNKLFQAWSPDTHPVTWAQDRRRWRNWNLVRTTLMIGALVLVLVANT